MLKKSLILLCVALMLGLLLTVPGSISLPQGKLSGPVYLPLIIRKGASQPSITLTPTPTSILTIYPNRTATPTPTPTSILTIYPNRTATPTPTRTSTLTVYPNGTSTPTATPTGIVGVIVDHTSLSSFASIPATYLQAAAALDTLFMHASVGDNIDYLGLGCLAGLQSDPSYPEECLTYAQNPYDPYDNRNWNWRMWDTPMADAIAKTDQWVSVVNAQQQNYQVLGMKFCYVDAWNQDFTYYRTKMEQLVQAYPQKTFIWATQVLYAKSDMDTPGFNLQNAQNIQDFNQQLRAYARANNIFLYDLADIESHEPNGDYCQSHDIEALCDTYSDGIGGGSGHPDADGSIRLAKGFWYLMARIAGW
jgi:hypothetical protein